MTIYTLTNSINGKQYVGKTKETAQKRFRQHVRDANKGSATAIHRAIRKYGEEAFIVSQLDTANTKEELNMKERRWIAELKTLGEGYNMTPGGEGVGHKHSEATKAKQRKARKNYFKNNPEARLQAADWAKQAKLSEEGRERKRQKMKGNSFAVGMTYQHTDDARLAISCAHKGKVYSKETRTKLSESRMGKATGAQNAMANPLNRAKVAASKIGRKKMYREDGTAYMGYPKTLNTTST